MNVDNYCLPPGYRSRSASTAVLSVTDGAQTRVYRWAAQLAARDPAITSVLDWGCGSGGKLVKFFARYDTLGVDLDYRLASLRARFPDRRWDVVPVPAVADMLLCVDVIEHLDDPAALLRHFHAGRWRHLVLATPERELVARRKYRGRRARRQQRQGPPGNRWHTREWTASEFSHLLTREFDQTPEIHILGRWNLVACLTRKEQR